MSGADVNVILLNKWMDLLRKQNYHWRTLLTVQEVRGFNINTTIKYKIAISIQNQSQWNIDKSDPNSKI